MWLMYIIRQLIPLKHGLKQGYNSKKSMYSMKYTFFKTVNPQFGGHPLYQMAIFTLENPLFIPDHYDTFSPQDWIVVYRFWNAASAVPSSYGTLNNGPFITKSMLSVSVGSREPDEIQTFFLALQTEDYTGLCGLDF